MDLRPHRGNAGVIWPPVVGIMQAVHMYCSGSGMLILEQLFSTMGYMCVLCLCDGVVYAFAS